MSSDSTSLFLHYENNTIFRSPVRSVLPVTLVTGFLGSGKTTLIKHLLAVRQNLRLATLVNDFADFNVDVEIVENELRMQRAVGKKKSDKHKQFALEEENRMKAKVTDAVGAVSVHSFAAGCICCSKPLVKEFEETVYEHLQTTMDDANGIDSLIIETSGLTNPNSIIAALDKKFGFLLC